MIESLNNVFIFSLQYIYMKLRAIGYLLIFLSFMFSVTNLSVTGAVTGVHKDLSSPLIPLVLIILGIVSLVFDP